LNQLEFKIPVELLSNRLRLRAHRKAKAAWNGRVLFDNPVSLAPVIEELTSGSGLGMPYAESWFEISDALL
jgi:hypothetical protein